MSDIVMEAIAKASHTTGIGLMYIASLNQVGTKTPGYAGGYNSRTFVDKVASLRKGYPGANLLICRDHLGPGFGDVTDSTLAEHAQRDMDAGFDLLHIDLCRSSDPVAAAHTLSSCKTLFEVGTDENTGEAGVSDILKTIIDYLNPVLCVAQTGSLIMDGRQVGSFNRQKVLEIAEAIRVPIKEHNADWVSPCEMPLRKGCVWAVNIAPELGTLQTMVTLQEARSSAVDFINLVLRGGKYLRWISRPPEYYTPLALTLIAGHYHFSSDEYKRLLEQAGEATVFYRVYCGVCSLVKDWYYAIT